jgi:hypothetical protein
MRTTILLLILGALAVSEGCANDEADSPILAIVFDQGPIFEPPDSCTFLDQACYDDAAIDCMAFCLDEDGNLDPACSNPGYRLCLQRARESCTRTSESTCGDCVEREVTAMTCSLDGVPKVQFDCNEQTKAGYEEMGLECTGCEFVRPPGEYKSCRCGPDLLWHQFCPDTYSPNAPYYDGIFDPNANPASPGE